MGLLENPLDLAVSRAKGAPLPEVPSFSDKRIRLLVSICRELQKITGANPFYLPTRKLGEVLEIHWTRVAKWLRALEVLGIIRLAPGEGSQAWGYSEPAISLRSSYRRTGRIVREDGWQMMLASAMRNLGNGLCSENN